MKNKGGGIILNPNSGLSPEQAFNYFMANSRIKRLTSGGNGATFTVTIKHEHMDEYLGNPTYVSVDSGMLAGPITSIIIKISATSNTESIDYEMEYINSNQDNIEMSVLTLNEFQKEYKIQESVFEKTCADLNSICPTPLCLISDIKDMSFFQEISSQFRFYRIKNKIKKYISNPSDIFFSLIAMEHIEGMYTLYALLLPLVPVELKKKDKKKNVPPPPIESKISRIITDERVQNMIALYIFKLCQLAQYAGIAHGDFHLANAMMLPDCSDLKILDYGKSILIPENLQSRINTLFMNFFTINGTMESLQALVNTIYQANNDLVFSDIINQEEVLPSYGWFIDNLVLSAVREKLLKLYRIHIAKTEAARSKAIELIRLVRPNISSTVVSDLHQRNSVDFVEMVVLEQEAGKEVEMGEKGQADNEEIQAAAEEAEQQQLAEEAEQQQLEGPEKSSIQRLHSLQVNLSLRGLRKGNIIPKKKLQGLQKKIAAYELKMMQLEMDLIRLAGGRSMNADELRLMLEMLSIKGGAAKPSELNSVLSTISISNSKPKIKIISKDDQIQAKIAEIKQIQADMAKIFADWRDEVYNIFTQPDDIKNAYYQTQTPFTILTHIMVCSGLFGPLTSGKYIDVKEEENKELYDKLNLIAGAFVTMNNGYLSMSNVKMQLMIEDAKKTTITTVEKVVEGPTVEVREDIDIDKTLIGPGPGEMINREELVAGFGGNKKYSRRKRRKYSKRQRKGCRRKSNKRFYSKKVTKKRRKYSKPK